MPRRLASMPVDWTFHQEAATEAVASTQIKKIRIESEFSRNLWALLLQRGRGRGGGNRVARLGVLRTPIFRGKCDSPEGGPRRRELQSDFGFAGANRAQEDDMALLLFLRLVVLKHHFAAAGQSRLQLNQRAMRIDRQRHGFLFERLSLRVATSHAHGNLHQDSLATSARTWVIGRAGISGHTRPSTFQYTTARANVECRSESTYTKSNANLKKF